MWTVLSLKKTHLGCTLVLYWCLRLVAKEVGKFGFGGVCVCVWECVSVCVCVGGRSICVGVCVYESVC